LAYLRTISSGHQEKLAPFKDDLLQLINKYPADKLIMPLVKQHLAYIDAHQAEMLAGEFALMDNDPNEVPFKVMPKPKDQIAAYNNSQLVQQVAQQRIIPITKKPEGNPANATANQPVKNPGVNNPASSTKAAPSIFSMSDSTNYYFVINISNNNTNPASSRFGIGQFNRANFQNGAITHQLMEVGDNNRLIYVGRFYSLGAVKDYARAIIPLMPDIMKIPKENYNFFIITQQNLDKITSKTRLDNYMDFYQNNY